MSSFTVAIVLLIAVLFWSFMRTSGFAEKAKKPPSLCDDVARLQKRYCGPPGTNTSFAALFKIKKK